MNDFLNVAKSLEIKEISKDVNCNVDDTSQDLSCDENIEQNLGNSHEEETIPNHGNEDGVGERKDNVISNINKGGQYPCNKCDKQFSHRKSLNTHKKSVHEGIKFPCSECGYKGSTKQQLFIHIQ